jgi:hypothetical protein
VLVLLLQLLLVQLLLLVLPCAAFEWVSCKSLLVPIYSERRG